MSGYVSLSPSLSLSAGRLTHEQWGREKMDGGSVQTRFLLLLPFILTRTQRRSLSVMAGQCVELSTGVRKDSESLTRGIATFLWPRRDYFRYGRRPIKVPSCAIGHQNWSQQHQSFSCSQAITRINSLISQHSCDGCRWSRSSALFFSFFPLRVLLALALSALPI